MHRSISIDSQYVLVESRVDTNNVLDLVIHLELQGIHGSIEMNLAAIF